MEEEKLITDLRSEDTDIIQKALVSLQEKLLRNNGVLIMRDLSKLKTCFVKIFQNNQKFVDSKIMILTFEFLNSFFSNNYGSDAELQFTAHVLPELIKY